MNFVVFSRINSVLWFDYADKLRRKTDFSITSPATSINGFLFGTTATPFSLTFSSRTSFNLSITFYSDSNTLSSENSTFAQTHNILSKWTFYE